MIVAGPGWPYSFPGSVMSHKFLRDFSGLSYSHSDWVATYVQTRR
jgi:hypothetical protein